LVPVKFKLESAVKIVGPEIPTESAVPIFARLRLLPLAVSDVRATELPIAPETTVLPLPLVKERVCAPSTVLDKVRAPLPATPELSAELAVRVIGEPIVMLFPVVARLAPRETAPEPDCVKIPLIVKLAAKRAVPLLLSVKLPAFVVVTVLLNWKADPVSVMPLRVDVDNAPLKIEVPLPAD